MQSFFFLLLRHLEFFEMLRNEDELALAKRFENVCFAVLICLEIQAPFFNGN